MGYTVLNAFRHRGERDMVPSGSTSVSTYRCSTPSGIEANETSRIGMVTHTVALCSTPSGIEANETRAAKAAASHLSSTCSTPSGIEANETAGAPMWYATHHRCSTPSGIEANETWLRCMGRNGRQVLNAFRHRGERDDATVSGYYSGRASCSTPSGIEANETAWKYLRCFAVYGCSTPSGIEANETRAAKAAASHLSSTCSTPSGIEANETLHCLRVGGGEDGVLNAFRHRGERDPAAFAVPQVLVFLCSTPSGIEANETENGHQRTQQGQQVLNAFRHRGERDLAYCPGGICDAGCSTPSGIEANETRPRHLQQHRAAEVLNAFRHRGERDPGPSPSLGRTRGAQRLPASRRTRPPSAFHERKQVLGTQVFMHPASSGNHLLHPTESQRTIPRPASRKYLQATYSAVKDRSRVVPHKITFTWATTRSAPSGTLIRLLSRLEAARATRSWDSSLGFSRRTSRIPR